ncbi:hypothetical protein LZ198_26430 [Myxococcus sp. K15C18031901]|uniref:hypothetical protein n=1 Tax=Myxococcus dinghuensis TaxID=2906761 RepID=UPI0020A77D14|nr:hypothetical protein [Myxococcus dinghuensis]MCP3102414.1 hypothetical protein [Myxococcus dinghuensis]
MGSTNASAAPWLVEVSQKISAHLLQSLQSDAPLLGELSSGKGALARGRTLSLAAYNQESITSYQDALKLDPSLYEARARLTVLQIRTGQKEAALESAKRLVEQKPTFELLEMTSDERINAYTLLGNALLLNGLVNESIQAYLSALRFSVTETTAAARLAQVYIATGKGEEALKLADTFANNPRFAEFSAHLQLVRNGQAQLPFIDLSTIELDVHGRPLSMVEEGARLAPIVHGDSAWCADVSDVLASDTRP